ncbi:MAG: hypothetical protein KAQ68_02175 [Clostridiales bacterium]|nr:hypothetical protein [Clostridiales bacterium]
MQRNRSDERDVIFSRMGMNIEEQKAYYARHPEKKEIDGELRASSWDKPMGDSMGYKLFDAFENSHDDMQDIIASLSYNMTPKCDPICDDATRLTRAINDIMPMFGVEAWGITKLNEENYYSYHGRGKYKNEPVDSSYPYAIVFLTSMNKDMINRAPRFETMLATLKGYTDVGLIGLQLANYINHVGYRADNNMTTRYKVVLPPLGEKAGLGSVGRHGLMVTKQWGSRVRLGAVLTDMPLVPNENKAFDITAFCSQCGLCARCCPGKAIDVGQKPETGWKISDTDCYRIWMAVGTDCGICLSACPLTQGVDNKLLDNIEDESVINEILRVHKEKYGLRTFIKEELGFLKD